MKVRDLIDQLKCMDENATVYVASDYGDIVNTVQAIPADECEEYDLYEDVYSRSGLSVAPWKADKDYTPEVKDAVVIVGNDCEIKHYL